MSLQPPQQPPSPGIGQSGRGLGFGPPGQSQSAPSSGEGRPGKTRHVSPVMIVSALVLIAVAVGVFVLTSGSDDALDAEGAAAGIAALVDDADFDEIGQADLRRCPFGDVEELAVRVADVLDLSDDVLDGDGAAGVEEADGSRHPALVWCRQTAILAPGSEGPTLGLSIDAGDLPRGDWEDFIEDSAGDEVDLEFDDPEDFRGGVIHSYCGESPDGGIACGADWVHEDSDVVVGLSHTTDDDDPEPAVEALKQLLPDLVESLAAQA